MENDNQPQPEAQSNEIQPIATGLGAVSGGVIGAAVGRSFDKKLGAAIGGVVGAIAGGIAGNAVVGVTEAVIDEIQPTLGLGLGADNKPIELPNHYSWRELQALSKPEGDRNYG